MTNKPGRAILLKGLPKGYIVQAIKRRLSQRSSAIFFPVGGAQTARELVVVSPRLLSEGGGELRCPSGYRSPIGIV